MSTKATIAYGPNFHFYHEVLDDDYVYLELEGVPFEAGYNRVMVPIPVHIWEVIRTYAGVDLSFAEKTDEEIRIYVEEHIDERIARYEAAENEKGKALIALLGSIPFGGADDPRDEQLARGLRYYERMREHQRQVKQAIGD